MLFRHFVKERIRNGKECGMSESPLSRATGVFKALGHPTRLRILAMLRAGGLCVCQITVALGLAASTVSAHLAELRRAGLAVEHRDGRWVSYSLAKHPRAAELLESVHASIDADPQVEADARLVRGLRRVAVEELCRVGLDLGRVGLRRPAPADAEGRT